MSDTTSGAGGEPQGPPAPELTLSHLDTLPTLAPVAVKLLEVTLDNDSSARDVVTVLHHDQSLMARILSVANSSTQGARGKIATLDRAVVLLGFKTVRSLALAVKVFECFPVKKSVPGTRPFELKEFWKHSLGVACAARRLAAMRAQLNVDPEEAFVAGLLHDLGKVALNAKFPKAYDRIAAQAQQARCDIVDCERTELRVDHTVAGRYLARRWHLPRSLQDVIWLHNKPSETLTGSTESPTLVALVQLANQLVRTQHIGHSGNCLPPEPASEPARRLGFAEAQLAEVLQDVVSDVADYTSLLGLDSETPETLYLKSLSRANAELSRLNTELLAANRQLTVAARCFKAITQFDRQLNASSDLAAVVAAIADTALTVLQRRPLAAFAVHDQRLTLELCWVGAQARQRAHTTQQLMSEMHEWLEDPDVITSPTIAPAPPAVRSMLTSAAVPRGKGECWLLPILHDEQLAGGIVYFSEHDERARPADELEELRPFLASLGLALGRVNAQAATQRLSEELAESGRRLQHTHAELLRTRTLRHIAKVAKGADHVLRDPLSVILGRAQMLREATEDAKVQGKLRQIEEAVQKCSAILTELRDSAEGAPPKVGEVDLTELLTELRDDWLTRTGLPAARFRVDLPEQTPGGDRPRLLVERDQIRTVLHEVVKNAVAATAENEGTIMIQARAGITLPASPLQTPDALPGEQGPPRWVEITVQDTGVGISPADAQHVFDPFFPLKTAGRGHGMGLARAHRTVEAHGGRIWFESRVGAGTTFYIRLPQVTTE